MPPAWLCACNCRPQTLVGGRWKSRHKMPSMRQAFLCAHNVMSQTGPLQGFVLNFRRQTINQSTAGRGEKRSHWMPHMGHARKCAHNVMLLDKPAACCRPPLQDAVDELAASSKADGSLGNGTDRYLASAQDPGPPPEGAAWRTVRVKFPKYVSSSNICALGVRAGQFTCLNDIPRAQTQAHTLYRRQ